MAWRGRARQAWDGMAWRGRARQDRARQAWLGKFGLCVERQARPGWERTGTARQDTAGKAGLGRQGLDWQGAAGEAWKVASGQDGARQCTPPSPSWKRDARGFKRSGPRRYREPQSKGSEVPMQTNGIHPGDVRLASAIAAGVPIAGTVEQARELVANENAFAARMAPDIIRCVSCRKLSPIGTVFGTPSDKCPPCARKAEDDERKAELWADALIDERKRPEYESQEDRDAEREYRQMRMGGRF